ncbi:MAG: EAL domain-containing protein [Lachnospiraceae bacterium]|nr:EAL domain-containing protein [Lachnospiraceae bacterium]
MEPISSFNIETQACGLVIVMIVMMLSFRRNSLALESRRRFNRFVISAFLCIVLDILSVSLIIFWSDGAPIKLLMDIEGKAYIGMLVVNAFYGLSYSVGTQGPDWSQRFVHYCRYTLPVQYIVILLLPISFYRNGRIVYSQGPACLLTYALCLFYILLSYVVLGLSRHTMSRKRRGALYTWMGLWIVAALVQLAFPEVLVVGFASSLGVLILYAELENPKEDFDKRYGIYTLNAFREYVDELYEKKKPFKFISINIDYGGSDYSPILKDEMIRRASIILNDNNYDAFMTNRNDLRVILDENQDLETFIELMQNSVAKIDSGYEDLDLDYYLIVAKDPYLVSSENELMYYVNYTRRHSNHEGVIYLDEAAIASVKRFLYVRDLITVALVRDRVVPFFQPIYNIETGKFTAAEALARIEITEAEAATLGIKGNILPPGIFIPVAEETGQIQEVGARILEKSCKVFREQRLSDLGLSYIEVNLSVRQCESDTLVGNVRRIMDSYQIAPDQINFEITESAIAENQDQMVENITTLREWGTSFSLDDFGTGASNLDYFVRMPVSTIKYDFKFTQMACRDNRVERMLVHITKMISETGGKIVSEGVETADQLQLMTSMGVNYIQGYYFSKPLPADEFVAFLKEKNAAA